MDQKPTNNNPYPTLNLGYDSESKGQRIVPSRRKLKYRKFDAATTSKSSESVILHDDGESRLKKVCRRRPVSLVLPSYVVFPRRYFLDYFHFLLVPLLTCIGFAKHSQNLDDKVVFLINVLKQKNLEIEALLKNKVNGLMDFESKCTCQLPLYLQLLKTSEDCQYNTGVTNLSLFQNLHDFIVPFIRRRWRGVSLTSKRLKRHYCKLPRRMWPARKILSKNEFLLLLMRLKLGLGEKDLADRFKISLSLTSNIISWLRGTADTLGKFVFVLDQEVLNDTKPPHFNPITNLRSIIDATELFLRHLKVIKINV